jgi:hypothetical protein
MANAFPVRLPSIDALGAGGWTFNSFTLNQAGDQHEVIFQAHDAISIARLWFRYGVRAGVPPTYKLSVQGVDASGNPDGTIKGGGSPCSVTVTPPADTTWNSTGRWNTLDNAYTTTRGEWLAMVIKHDSGSIDASNCSSFSYDITGVGGLLAAPYVIGNDNGSRTRRNNGLPLLGYGTTSLAFGFPITAEANVNSIVSPAEYGNVFTLPSGWGTSCKIVGVRIVMSPPAASSITLNLYDGGNAGDTTVLQNVTIDGDFTASVNRPHIFMFDESTLSTLLFGNAYRISVAPAGAVPVTMRGFDVAANADLNAFPFGITNYSTTRSGGNWTDTNTRRFHIEPILEDITGGGGSGGSPRFALCGSGPSFRGAGT